MPLTQDYRSVSVTSPLAKDSLMFLQISGSERLGRPYEFVLDLVSKDRNIQASQLLGKPMTVALSLSNGQDRYFTGLVTSFGMTPDVGELAGYRACLSAELWFLSRASNCRIFQDKTVPDIIKQILREHGITQLRESLTESYRTRDYCVQYRETDLDFIHRLMEEEGIYYFFDHKTQTNILNLVDSPGGHAPCPGYDRLPYFPPENSNRRERDHVFAWACSHTVQSGVCTLTDFDFEKPRANLMAKLSQPKANEHGQHEQYDFPGGYIAPDHGSHYAKIKLQALQSGYQQYFGEGNAFGLTVGSSFSLHSHPRADLNQEYLVTEIDFFIHSNAYQTGSEHYSAFDERLAVTGLKKSTPFRPPQVTPRPFVRGPQTAIVVGKSGEEIWTDKYGRVKVQFHWDREGKNDEKSSCWVRVSHPWAGQGWGAISIPRIGQEVIVDFLEGDPDRPIITGRVYNADQMAPYGLPGKATQSGIKSRSTKGAAQDNFNEIRMEDQKGSEELYIHAEKDMNVVVENSETRKVGFEKKSPGNQLLDIYNHRTTTLDQGNDTLQIKKGNQSTQLDMGNCSLTVKMGNQETKIDLGKSSTEAMQSIELKVGQSSIKVDQMGVTIKGMTIKIEGTLQTEVKGMMTQVKGDAMLTVKGAITMIN